MRTSSAASASWLATHSSMATIARVILLPHMVSLHPKLSQRPAGFRGGDVREKACCQRDQQKREHRRKHPGGIYDRRAAFDEMAPMTTRATLRSAPTQSTTPTPITPPTIIPTTTVLSMASAWRSRVPTPSQATVLTKITEGQLQSNSSSIQSGASSQIPPIVE